MIKIGAILKRLSLQSVEWKTGIGEGEVVTSVDSIKVKLFSRAFGARVSEIHITAKNEKTVVRKLRWLNACRAFWIQMKIYRMNYENAQKYLKERKLKDKKDVEDKFQEVAEKLLLSDNSDKAGRLSLPVQSNAGSLVLCPQTLNEE